MNPYIKLEALSVDYLWEFNHISSEYLLEWPKTSDHLFLCG